MCEVTLTLPYTTLYTKTFPLLLHFQLEPSFLQLFVLWWLFFFFLLLAIILFFLFKLCRCCCCCCVLYIYFFPSSSSLRSFISSTSCERYYILVKHLIRYISYGVRLVFVTIFSVFGVYVVVSIGFICMVVVNDIVVVVARSLYCTSLILWKENCVCVSLALYVLFLSCTCSISLILLLIFSIFYSSSSVKSSLSSFIFLNGTRTISPQMWIYDC